MLSRRLPHPAHEEALDEAVRRGERRAGEETSLRVLDGEERLAIGTM